MKIIVTRWRFTGFTAKVVFAMQHIWCLSQARIIGRVAAGRASSVKLG